MSESIICLTCAERVASSYRELTGRWIEGLKSFPRHLPDDMRDRVFNAILDKLVEALSTDGSPFGLCSLDKPCTMFHDSGHEMARMGYTIEEVLKIFARLHEVLWDFLSTELRSSHSKERCDDGVCENATGHGSCYYKINLFFQEITGSIALAYVEEMERIIVEKEAEIQAKELEVAGYIMEALLPKEIPAFPGLDVAGKVIAAGTVGGDFWDLSVSVNGEIELLVADVMGHGVSAAMLVAMIKYLHSAHRDLHFPMSRLMEKLNARIMADTPAEVYIAAILARINRDSGKFTYVNAGYPPPRLVRQGRLTELRGSDVPLGLFSDGSFAKRTFLLKEGDVLLFMSDGVSEARSSSGEFFGRSKLNEIVNAVSNLSASEICTRIIEEVTGFCRDRRCKDDITVVVLKMGQLPEH
jgi:hypothetical protein